MPSPIVLPRRRTRAPSRDDYITKIAGTSIADPGTPHPLWSGFLDKVTGADEHLIGFLQRYSGYCLTGHVGEHVLVFVFGPGGNGKGVFISTLTRVMGNDSYAISAPMEMLLASKHDRHPTRSRGSRAHASSSHRKRKKGDDGTKPGSRT